MKHEVINVDDPKSFRDSVMDLIDFTPDMLADELKKALNVSGVDEGVPGSIHCFRQIAPGGVPLSYCIVDVSPMALPEWKNRIAHCISLLENQRWFHVEQFVRPCLHRDLTQFQITVRYERP